VQECDQIRAVVQRDLRPVTECRFDIRVILVGTVSAGREHRNSVLGDESGRDVILRRELIASAQPNVCAARRERQHEVGGLRGNV
jgi:hypothetical protein